MSFTVQRREFHRPPHPLQRVDGVTPKIGFVSGGLGAYWPQFDGLLDQLKGVSDVIRQRIEALGSRVQDFGFVSDPVEGDAAASAIRSADCDLLVVYVSTYMTSGQILPVLRDCGAPILLVQLQPGRKMDHATFGTGDWLAYAGSAGLPEICVGLERLGKPVRVVAGHLDDERAWRSIERWVAATGVMATLKRARHGMMGHLYPGMFDIATSITSVLSTFGGHAEILELDDLRVRYEAVTEPETERALETIRSCFEITPGIDWDNVRFQARVSAALDTLVRDYDLSTLAYFHFGQPSDIYQKLATGFPIGATLLTSRGIPSVTEYEVRAAIAMYVLNLLGGGGTLTEGQALDFDAGVAEIGHNDAADMAITARKPALRQLDVFHGKGGGGASIEVDVAPGPVTQFSIGELGNGRLRFIASEGTVVDGPHIKIGNTTSRVDFGCDPGVWTEEWAKSGSTHHWGMGVGHLADDIEALADLLGAEFRRVQP
ncbi:L-fucose/L-arabinose isomerase family protein [Streptomyces sp. NBC_00483]|uniref:L-fucose/L-arabinose isomerase family protein n=1 Tax=Streptomyces sp. NBC_00483 TaxID=2975756 RepID=UPI002E1916AD